MSTSANGGRPSAGEPEGAHDSDAGLQEELRREAAEHAALGGDTSTDRNLTGSTTWITLGEGTDGPAADHTDAPDGRTGSAAP